MVRSCFLNVLSIYDFNFFLGLREATECFEKMGSTGLDDQTEMATPSDNRKSLKLRNEIRNLILDDQISKVKVLVEKSFPLFCKGNFFSTSLMEPYIL